MKRFLILTLVSFLFVLLFGCNSSPAPRLVEFKGETMGTFYAVKYIAAPKNHYQKQIDSLLLVVNQSLSTYIPTSTVSKVNRYHQIGPVPVDAHFAKVFERAKKIHHDTDGAFDPTVMPLVNAWGFGYEKNANPPDGEKIDSLLQLVNFGVVELNPQPGSRQMLLNKLDPNVQLDFSAMAKGYGVDVIAEFLEKMGVTDYLVDIGGELRAKGKSGKGNAWSVGIDKPLDAQSRQLQNAVELNNRAIATSGNYRNFYVKDGKKYAHTINPKTGYPEASQLLSVSVFAPDCMTADAYATAFMVMGWHKAAKLANLHDHLDAFFIIGGENGELTTDATRGVVVK